MTALVDLQNVTLKFRIYRNPNPNLKETVVNLLAHRNKINDYIEFSALNNISMTFRGGERVGIVGLNGAGKSTLLKAIVGIYPPHSGKILVQGSVTPLIEMATGFDMELSGRENIYLNGAILGISPRVMARKEKEIIEFSELKEFINMPVKYYSSGMFSRLAFSIATMVEPEILIVDEVFAGGDAHFVSKATNRMLSLMQNSQIVLFVSHNLEQVAQLCNQVVVLNKGEVVARGEPAEMIDLYKRTIVNAS